MILNSTKFGGNRTKDLEVGLYRQTDGQTDGQTERQTGQFLYTPQTTFAGGIIKLLMNKKYNATITRKAKCQI
jgi:hypothetical protein